jgi:YD repeat-containing protein
MTNTSSYDERGNRLTQSLSTTINYSDGKSYLRSGSYTYQYDANDFLVRLLVQQSDTDISGTTTMQSNDITYEYSNNRLSKSTHVNTANGATTTTSFLYEYDGQGRLTKLANMQNNSYSKFEYLGNNSYKITRVDMNGNSNSPFLEFNGAGLVVKSIVTQFGSTTEERYEYNADGLLIRRETYDDGKPRSAVATEYDNKTHPYPKSFTEIKGHPTIPATGPGANYLHNITRMKTYDGNATNGRWDIREDVSYSYEYNSENLPVSGTSKTLNKNGDEISTGTMELDYQDCP